MSQDSGSGLHVEGSRKSDGYCETSCKKQRVGLMTQRKICSCDAVKAHQQTLTHSKDVYNQVSSRSPHVDVSVSPCSMEEGEIIGAGDDVYLQDVYSHKSARGPQMSEGGLPETGAMDKYIPIRSWGRTNAKRSKRCKRCVWSFEGRQKERGEMGLIIDSSKLAGQSVNLNDGMPSFLENSEVIEKIYGIHTKHMQELKQKQNMEVSAYLCSKKERKGRMEKGYELQKVLIGELYGVSLSKSDKLKKLDETYQTKLEGLCHEMKKCWVNLKAEHETARTNEEEMRSKMIHLLKKITASTLPEGSDKAEDSAASTSIDSGNRSSLDIVEVSPDNLPIKDMTVMHADPDTEIQEVSAPGIMEEFVIPGSSSVEQLDALDDQITLDDPLSLPGCSTLPQSKLGPGNLKDSEGQILKDSSVTEGQVPRKSVQDFNDEVGQLDIEDFEISLDCWAVEEVTLQNDQNQVSQGLLQESEQSVSNRVVPHIYVISDDELMHEVSAAAPANELQDANNLSKEVPSTSSVKQINPLTVESSRNELAACLSMDNLHEEAHIIPNGVATGRSSPCVASAGGGCDSMDQDRAVEELRQQSQTNTPADSCSLGLIGSAPCSILEQQSTYQGRQLPLEQACTTVPLRTDLQVTDGFSSLPTWQFVGTASYSQPLQSSSRAFPLMMPQVAREPEEITHPQLSYPGGNSQLHNARSNSHHSVCSDPLQVQLEDINKAGSEAQKKHKDMLAQLAADRERAIAKIDHEYILQDQSAQIRWMQTKEELRLCYEKTKAQKLLADTWRSFTFNENIPLDIVVQPSSLSQPGGLPSENSTQRNASAPSHQFPNQSSLVRCTGLPGSQRNVSGYFRQFANQYTNVIPTDKIVRPIYLPPHHPLHSDQGRLVPYVPDPHLGHSLPGASNPLAGLPQSQMNRHTQNFCSSSSPTGSYSQPCNSRDYLAHPQN